VNQAPAGRSAQPAARPADKKQSADKWENWKKRFENARQAIDDAEADLEAARARVGILRRGLTYGDPQDFNQKAQTDQALQTRSDAEKALADAKQALNDLREEARKAGVPAYIRR
jgi:chromosome segregation ATPase